MDPSQLRMEAIGIDVPTNEENTERSQTGSSPSLARAGAPAPGSFPENFHNSLGGSPSAADGASDEEIAGPLDDGFANKSLDADGGDVAPSGGGRGIDKDSSYVYVAVCNMQGLPPLQWLKQ